MRVVSAQQFALWSLIFLFQKYVSWDL